MAFHFFIQQSNYRANIFKEIHEIVFHGKGGFDWDTVYNMPIWLRRYTYNEIKVFYDKEREEYENAQGSNTITSKTDPRKIIDSAPKQATNAPSFVSKIKSSPKSNKK